MSDIFNHEADAWESRERDYEDGDPGQQPRTPPKCRYCGANCWWSKTATGWALYQGSARHACAERNLRDFEVLP